MSAPIKDPVIESKEIPFSQYLGNIAQALDVTTDLESKKLAGALNSVIESYKNLDAKLKAKSAGGVRSEDLSAEEAKFLGSLDQLKSDGIQRAIQKYWQANGKGDNLSKLQSYERLGSDLETGNRISLELAKAINNIIANANAQRKVDVAHSAFVNSFQKKNTERIKKLNLVWNKNRNYQDTEDAIKDMIPVLQLCLLNAGLSFFGTSDFEIKSRNLVAQETPKEYRDACDQFKCKLPLFDSKKYEDGGVRAREFKKYQCSMYVRYPDIINNITENMKKTGNPCP